MLKALKAAKRSATRAVQRPLLTAKGWSRALLPWRRRFVGAYPSYEAAVAAQGRRRMVGYNHPEVANVSYDLMCDVALWDYPVLFWLERLLPDAKVLVDAGGHMGTKYKAFRPLLDLSSLSWVVHDLPEIVKAGARKAQDEGLPIVFEDDAAKLPPADIVLASGLFQYLPETLEVFLNRMGRPRHVLINKVAVRDGPMVVTMEGIGPSRVPYQIRDQREFLRDIEASGYRVVDQWRIGALAHTIDTHPQLGPSTSCGFYLIRA